MQASKEEQEAALRQQLKQAAAAQGAELHRYRDASLELKREVERLRHTVETYKAESEQTVKELQQQKDINRRLSRRLSSLSQADPLSDHEDAPGHDAAEQPAEHHRAAPAESAALQSPARSHKSPGKPARRPQEPPTPAPRWPRRPTTWMTTTTRIGTATSRWGSRSPPSPPRRPAPPRSTTSPGTRPGSRNTPPSSRSRLQSASSKRAAAPGGLCRDDGLLPLRAPRERRPGAG
eukprot:TRINITY_DN2755_c0_g1_i3.p2 TRINITY_DN2755_c0_g1~~TRINITY_DN2755_c0_g1_i3.p2  ORF type:complete len:235 (-),score=26.67 TRINITY_DN2755_c0_g1_i3:382-1086(-)